MTNLEIYTQDVKVSNQDLEIAAYLAHPVGDGCWPAVIVFQEVFGVNAYIREVTERLAREGYVAIAPALYQRQAPDFEVGYSDAELQLGRQYKEQTTASELLSDTQATLDYLKTLPVVQSGAIGCVGFCFGGHVAYLAATLPEIKATAAFYGAGITNWTPGGGEPTLTRTPEIAGTVYAFFGTVDPLIPNEQVDQLETELQQAQIRHRVFRYEGATHGFLCNHRASYHPEAAADAWFQMLQLFEQTLRTA